MTSAIIDIVALALIAVSTVLGFKKGFTKTFVSTFGTILSIVFALLLAGVTAKFLEKQFSLTTSIANGLEGTLTGIFGDELMNSSIGEINDTNLHSAGLSSLIVKMVLSVKGDTNLPAETTLNKIVAPTFAYYITVIISAIILYILFKIAFFLVAELVVKAHKWKIVKGLDGTLGLMLGTLRGIIFVQVIIMIIGVLPFDFFNTISDAIPKTVITNTFSKINLLPTLINTISDSTHIIKLIIG